MYKGSIHIKYKKNYRYAMFDAFIKALETCAKRENKLISELTVLDVGCGRGEFLEYAIANGISRIEGCDFDPVCVEMSSEHAKCYIGDINNADIVLKDRSYDVILLSHLIEHLQDPKSVLKKLMPLAGYFLIAVPNPLRPNVLYFAVKRHNYSNLGHYYAWDRSHFTVFVKKCSLNIVDCYVDDVRLPKNKLINTMRKLKLLSLIETRILPNLFPYFSSSLIFLCRKSE